jgi:hypothetical protein
MARMSESTGSTSGRTSHDGRGVYRKRGLPPECHPDRPHMARGLCHPCYLIAKDRGEFGPKATCHPHRGLVQRATGECGPCYKNRLRREKCAADPAYAERWQVLNTVRQRRSQMKRVGATLEWYVATLEAQGGGCAICRRPPPENRVLDVDHDHVTGDLRGLLCGPCNRLLGIALDDPGRLTAAAAYINRVRIGAD